MKYFQKTKGSGFWSFELMSLY